MGKAQSKVGILTEKRKYKRGDEDYKDDCQEEDGTDGRCNKTDKESLFYGTHEIQEASEGGEADLQTFYTICTKNPGHTKFVPVNDFNIKDLPKGYHDNDIVEYLKATADLTVRVAVTMTSTKRPQFWPNTDKPYPFYDKRGSNVTMLGTGMVMDVNQLTEEEKTNMGTCRCHKCQQSVTPSKVWSRVRMLTATHVVFDDFEARHTICRLFYDRQDSPLVTLEEWTVERTEIEEDWCLLQCVSCDLDLVNKLYKMWGHLFLQRVNVFNKYKRSRDKHKLSLIVSHPHGCPKQISVGHWIDRNVVNDDGIAKYTYTTCTCPGSSGAHVHSLGYDNWLYYDRFVHSGVNSKGINFSGTGRDFPTDL